MRQWTVDAFAATPFKGNPACIVEPFDARPDAAWMQALAAENNQAYPGRGGGIEAEPRGPRVLLGAVTVIESRLRV